MDEYMNKLFKEVAKNGFSIECFPDFQINLQDLYYLESSPSNFQLEPTFDPFTCQLTGFTEASHDKFLQQTPILIENNHDHYDFDKPEIIFPASLNEIYLKFNDNIDPELFSENLSEINGFKGVKFDKKDNSWLQNSKPSNNNIIKLQDILDDTREFNVFDEKSVIPELDIQISEVIKRPVIKDSIWAEAVADANIIKCMESFKFAFEFGFKLDAFQLEAIYHLEQGHNVFVSAHTSAGKTVIADYAIALSKQHMTKVIYTSPIKALSNQKYREFKKKFDDVGIVTGDIQISSNSSCLIMTTEILRSMLYYKSETINDLEWVIFDEVHYINDAERGVVWEEVFIMLPQNINIVMLSATVPNVLELAEWIGFTRKKKVFVVSTSSRPIPLEHFIFTGSSLKSKKELFLILKPDKSLNLQGYKDAVEDKKSNVKKASSSRNDLQLWRTLIHLLETKNKMPAIVFTFSKRRINETVETLTNIDLLTSTEKSRVIKFFDISIKKLKDIDKQLPQVLLLKSILSKGIGMHHSGVLPILKEIVEILFQAGIVKILFATETFSMGVNMPARTVIFDGHRKHDGIQMRDLLPGEYIQMAGRAGRRRLDTTGTVIIMFRNDIPEISDLSIMMTGKPVYLQSQFRITYSMILKLLRNESLQITDMMKRSFIEYHKQKNINSVEDKYKELIIKENEQKDIIHKDDLAEYYDTCEEWLKLKDKIQAEIISNRHISKLLVPGRIIVITDPIMYAAAVIIENLKDNNYKVLLNKGADDIDGKFNSNFEKPFPHIDEKIVIPNLPIIQKLITIPSKYIVCVINKIIKINSDFILSDAKKKSMNRREDPENKSTITLGHQLLKYIESQDGILSPIDPIKDLQVQKDISFVESIYQLKKISAKLDTFNCFKDPLFKKRFDDHRTRMKLKDEIFRLKHLLSDQSLMLHPDYQKKLQVLRRLKHLNQNDDVLMKGKIACEISNHELIITELIVEGIFRRMNEPTIAAILSAIVFQEKQCVEPELNSDLVQGKDELIKIVRYLGAIMKECGLSTSSEIYLEEFNFGLMQVVYDWAKGESFKSVLQLTDVQEGVIVRCMQQLQEVIRDVQKASKIVGDGTLLNKMDRVSTIINRDIVFAQSLYTNPEIEYFFKS